VAVLDIAEESYLSVRTNRVISAGCPPETTQLEFKKSFCIACIGEDIPEGLLTKIGVPLVTGGAANKKRIVVSPLLETRQPNVYLAGDVLSPAYFETTEFDDSSTFKEVKRRGNIKAAMRDGVLIAEVIDQKLAGKTLIEVHLEFEEGGDVGLAEAAAPAAEPAVSPPVAAVPPAQDSARQVALPTSYGDATVMAPRRRPSHYRLVAILQSGVEANEYSIKTDGPTSIGRQGADVSFPEDLQLSDIHASIIPGPEGYRVKDEGSAEGVYVRPVEGRLVSVDPGAIIRVGRQWLVAGDDPTRPRLMHYNENGQLMGHHELKQGTTIIGRQSPDVTIAPEDSSISRRHFATIVQGVNLSIKDLGSGNGTYIKVGRPMLLQHGDQLHLGRQVLQFSDETLTASPADNVAVQTAYGRPIKAEPAQPVAAKPAAAKPAPAPPAPPPKVAAPAPAPAAAAAPAAPAAAPATGEPSVMFESLKRQVACTKGQTICEAAEHAGIKMDADCHAGVCGMDPVKVISGAEHLGPLSSTEKGTLEDLCSLEPGPYRLACMARVSGAVVVDIVKQ
jgi:pSer/pThr/pTyr-binding forkhead associated (FHA) protein/ferredoxin